MPLTTEANETTVHHIITAALDRELDGPLKKALDNDEFTNIHDEYRGWTHHTAQARQQGHFKSP